MSSPNEARINSIDFVIKQVSSRLVSTQQIDFRKLRQVSLLASDPSDSELYSTIITLAIIKYLEIGEVKDSKIPKTTEALRLFNALNLNDPTINAFFVEMILVLVPEITTSLIFVMSDIMSKLADMTITDHTFARLETLEHSLNKQIEDGEILNEEVINDEENNKRIVPVKKRESKRRSKEEKMSFKGLFIDGSRSKDNNSSRRKHSKGKEQPDEIKKRESKRRSSSSTGSHGKGRFVELKAMSLTSGKDANKETASETAERLSKGKSKVDYDEIYEDVRAHKKSLKDEVIEESESSF